MESIDVILASNMIGTLATLNDDGSPWATPLHIIAHDGFVYWFSKDTHQHSQNILRDPRVSVSLWAKDEGAKGAYISGVAERLEGEKAEQAFAVVKEKFGSLPPVSKIHHHTVSLLARLTEVNRQKTVGIFTPKIARQTLHMAYNN